MNKILYLITLSSLLSCGTPHKYYGGRTKTNEWISITVSKVKSSKNSYKVRFKIKNETNKMIVLKEEDISCMRGNIQGNWKKKIFRKTTDPLVVLSIGESTKYLNNVCEHEDSTGDFFIKIAKVFKVPKSQNLRKMKQFGKELIWSSNVLDSIPITRAQVAEGKRQERKRIAKILRGIFQSSPEPYDSSGWHQNLPNMDGNQKEGLHVYPKESSDRSCRSSTQCSSNEFCLVHPIKKTGACIKGFYNDQGSHKRSCSTNGQCNTNEICLKGKNSQSTCLKVIIHD